MDPRFRRTRRTVPLRSLVRTLFSKRGWLLIEVIHGFFPEAIEQQVKFDFAYAIVLDYSLDDFEYLSLLKNKPAKINLIPFNPFSDCDYQRSSSEQIRLFQAKLRELGVVVTTRKTRGDDIDAACGQLAGKVSNKVLVRLSEKKRRAVVL